MDRLTAALRIAKIVALHTQRTNVDLDCFDVALQFISPSDTDTDATEAGVRAGVFARTSTLAGGARLAALYRSDPQLRLSDALATLKAKLSDSVWSAQPPGFVDAHTDAASDGDSTAAPFDVDEVIAAAWRRRAPAAAVSQGRAASLRSRLAGALLGQPVASELLCDEIAIREWNFGGRPAPQIFVLAGPPASGKSAMAELLAREFPDRPLLTLQMASYQNEREGFGLIGLRFGWSEARPGRLTSFVWDNPRAIVVFDNIDLAHAAVRHLLLPLLVSGTLDDEFGFGGNAAQGHPIARSVDFSDTMLLFTTNEGASVYEQPGFDATLASSPAQAVAQLRAALAAAPTAATPAAGARSDVFMGQLSQCALLPFQALALPALQQIAGRHLRGFAEGLATRGVRCDGLDDDALAFVLTLAMGPEINARELASVARELMHVFVRDCSDAGAAAACLRVRVAATPTLAALRANAPAVLQHQLLRRSERLRYTMAVQRADDTLVITFSDCALERVRVTSDYGKPGGFVTELPTLGFDAIVGHERVKQRLRQVVALLQVPATLNGSAVALPKGMLLYGSPGTGKTMLARALAAEAALPFLAVTGPQLLDVELIKTLFQRARKFAPSVIFIDEIDALGVRGERGADYCINQLLTEIDGFADTPWGGVFIVAATNFPGRVDPALTRSGRLDLHVDIPMLDREARALFIERFARLPHTDSWDAATLVDLSAGMSGADLEKVLRECQLELIRTGAANVTQADVLEQINVVRYGQRVSNPPLRDQLVATAFHEAGHAVVSMVLNPEVRVQQVTIAPRRDALGFTSYDSDAPGANLNRARVLDRICVALSGRLAETRRFPADGADGGDDAGAASDLHSATRLAWRAITEWGLDDEFGWLALPALASADGALAQLAQARSAAWIEAARTKAAAVIDAHWASIERVAARLLEHEMIDGNTLRLMLA